MGASILVLMMLLVCSNVVARLFGYPIKGTFEIVGFQEALVIGFGIGYTQRQKAHVAIGVVVLRLRKRTQAIIGTITSFVSMGIIALISWQCALLATGYWEAGQLSSTLLIPFFPMIYGVAFGCLALALVLLLDFQKSLAEVLKR